MNEFCHRCGRTVTETWLANNELWQRVVEMGEAGVRCISCFNKECEENKIYLIWHCKKYE